jgi:hypothetical protein
MASRLVPFSSCINATSRLITALTLTNISMYTTVLMHHVAGGQVGAVIPPTALGRAFGSTAPLAMAISPHLTPPTACCGLPM